MRTFRQLMEAQESSNQIKKIKIVFGEGGSANDAEWNLGKIETEITLAMGDHSRDCFALAEDIGKFNGIPKEEAETYKETPTDALIYGMTNLMNGGDDEQTINFDDTDGISTIDYPEYINLKDIK